MKVRLSVQAAGRAEMERRLRRAARTLGLSTREYVNEAAKETHLHDADIHAVGILRAAHVDERDVTPGELGRELNLSPAAVTALVNRMERAGHIVRMPSTVDRRSITLHATKSATDMSNTMFDPLVDRYHEVLEDYDDRDLALVAEVMDRLAEATRDQARTDIRHH